MRRSGILLIAALSIASGCARRDPPASAASATPAAAPATLAPPALQPASSTSPSAAPTLTVPPVPAPQVSPPSATPSPLLFFPAPLPTESLPAPPTVAPLVPAPPVVNRTLPPVPVLPPDAPPQILAVQVPSTMVFGGETVDGSVIASSNVASVELRVASYSRAMDKIAPGEFTVAVTVPRLPFFLRGRTWSIQIIARNARGDSVAQTLPITVR